MGRLPLYKEAATARCDGSGNLGLWYDKFCNCWDEREWSLSAYTGRESRNPKLDWIKTAERTAGERKLLNETVLRRLRLLDARGRPLCFQTVSRFVTGLGRNHPVENGFAWHPTLGAPYLPGSSVKGLVRSWAREEEGIKKEDLDLLLGSPGQVGQIAVLEAIPLVPPTLEAEVLTPHYANWTPEEPPGDWRSPTPIPFLVTQAGALFLFGLLPLPSARDGDLDQVASWLEAALIANGAGAKTAVGFGRMKPAPDRLDSLRRILAEEEARTRKAQEELERQARLSPLERELEALVAGNDPSLPAFLHWLNLLEKGHWSAEPDRQREVAHLIRKRMEEAGRWKPTSQKKNPAKDKDHQRTLQLMKYLTQP